MILRNDKNYIKNITSFKKSSLIYSDIYVDCSVSLEIILCYKLALIALASHVINLAVLHCCGKQFFLCQEVLSSLNIYLASLLLLSVIISP